MQQAQEIYYKIKKENIQFQSDTGEEFLLSLYENMTDAQIQEINRAVRRKRQKRQNRRQLLRINRRIACAVSAVVLASSILCINWSLLMDLRTNYQTKKLQEKVIVQSDNLKDDKSDASPISDEGTVFFPNEDETNTAQDNTSDGGILLKFTQLYNENRILRVGLEFPERKSIIR